MRFAVDVVGPMLALFRSLDPCGFGYVRSDQVQLVLQLVGSLLTRRETKALLQRFRIPVPAWRVSNARAHEVDDQSADGMQGDAAATRDDLRDEYSVSHQALDAAVEASRLRGREREAAWPIDYERFCLSGRMVKLSDSERRHPPVAAWANKLKKNKLETPAKEITWKAHVRW